jgi:hypothetical protein
MVDGSSGAGGEMSRIAEQLERLARDARATAEGATEAGVSASGEPMARGGAARTVAEAEARLHAEADRAVAEAVRVLDRSVAAARARVLEAEREARERILAATESACERIEAVDHAQERVATALSRLGPGARQAGDESARA